MLETGLTGRVVIVTGAAGGIGKATAALFAQQGCRVASWDRRPSEAESGGVCQIVDVTNPGSVEDAVNTIMRDWGRIDVLVNNAGVLRDSQLLRYKEGHEMGFMTDEQFDSVIAVNLKGVFTCTRAVARHMIPVHTGVILNAASVVGVYGNFGQTNYVASKSGVIGMTRVWARELGRYGIRVNAVAPGMISTDMVSSMPEKALQSMREHTPLGRFGTTQDVANAYVWLASDLASFVTGTVLGVDGGLVPGT
jgi:3-oxoacyl-[acyl-carrier protein] reductase